MKNSYYLVCFLLATVNVQAQNEDSSTLANYHSSIVTKVYDFTSRVNLPAVKQKALANFFRKEDSLAASLIVRGVAKETISLIQTQMQKELSGILSTQQWDEYYNAKYGPVAKKQADIFSRIAAEKYQCNAAILKTLNNLYYRRALSIDKILFSRLTDSAVIENQVINVSKNYDSLIDRYEAVAKNAGYIQKRITELNEFKNLAEDSKEKLEKIFNTYTAKNVDKSPKENFEDAMRSLIKDTAYYLNYYKDEIGKIANSNAKQAAKNILQKNKLTKISAAKLLSLLVEREKAVACLNKVYPFFTQQKDSLLNEYSTHYDSLVTVFLIREGSSLSGSQFAIAIKYRDPLGINDTLLEWLLAKETQYQKMKADFYAADPFGKFDSKAFETNSMLEILSEDTYHRVLLIKNRSQAKSEAKQDWDDMVERHLVKILDKDSTVKMLEAYYLAKWGAYYRYGNDKIKQTANVKVIQEHMPDILKALNAARKYSNPVTSDASSTYKW